MLKKYLKRNSFSIVLTIALMLLLIVIPSQIKISLVSKATVSPRFFPYVSTIGALVCCILSLIIDAVVMYKESLTGQMETEEKKDDNISHVRVMICIGLLFAWYLVLPKIGFTISTAVVLFLLTYMLGNRNKISLIVFPIVFTLATYFIFSGLLSVRLPEILF